MNDIAFSLSDAPVDVRDFIGNYRKYSCKKKRINILSPSLCEEHTNKMLSIPVVRELGLIVLDDANDSNPYCFISSGVAAGMVVHFCHDPEPCIKYASLALFIEALNEVLSTGDDIDDMESLPIKPIKDQEQLRKALLESQYEDPNDRIFFISLYLPLLDTSNIGVLITLSNDDDFFVREAVSNAIEANPHPEHKEILMKLSKDRYPQVANPSKRALSALNKREHNQ